MNERQKVHEQRRVLYEKHGQVAYVTLNRPLVLNAMDSATHKELAQIWDDFECDPGIRVGVLSGCGDKAFSVGQDLKERAEKCFPVSSFGSGGGPGAPRLTERFALTKPIVARVNGYALGGGFELALACDIVVAAEHAVFGLPEAKLGLIAGAGGVFRLARQIPYRIAAGYLMTGRSISASRAFDLGLVNDVKHADELDACVNDWVTDILRCAPLSVRAIKEAMYKSVDMPLEEAFDARYEWEVLRMQSEDAQEGIRAFLEKRVPEWKGR